MKTYTVIDTQAIVYYFEVTSLHQLRQKLVELEIKPYIIREH